MLEGPPPHRLKRALNPLPEDIRALLEARGLMDAYRARPDYQQNDYLGWIGRAKREETRHKRLDQMLAELEEGTRYMNMAWRPRSQ
ncbi:YdeI/OmpD-associated family protein [bacterium]|nr:YdeI/OmpD-associated family protein [bacterium]